MIVFTEAATVDRVSGLTESSRQGNFLQNLCFRTVFMTTHSGVYTVAQSFYLGGMYHHYDALCGLKDLVDFGSNSHQGWELFRYRLS